MHLIQLINSLGQIMQSTVVHDLYIITLVTEDLANGIYFIKLNANEGITIKKIMKQ